MCYVANVGDSRAVMSGDAGAKIFPLSRDHKPSDELEQKRIIEAGGKIYQYKHPSFVVMYNKNSSPCIKTGSGWKYNKATNAIVVGST